MGGPYIVRIELPVEEFRDGLREIPEATLLRELDPGRVVVIAPPSAVGRLAALPGVREVTPDRLRPMDR